MIKAVYSDKAAVVQILTESFKENKSVNYIIPQDGDRTARIRSLMEYSFDLCFQFGEVLLSQDRKCCALLLHPDKKKSNLKTTLLDLKLITKGIGLGNVRKTLSREAFIKQFHPKAPFAYLWFIGTDPSHQGKGIGSELLRQVIETSRQDKRPVYLETSTQRNIKFYKDAGFSIYNASMRFGYPLYFLSNN